MRYKQATSLKWIIPFCFILIKKNLFLKKDIFIDISLKGRAVEDIIRKNCDFV